MRFHAMKLKSFSPPNLEEVAQQSGFFHCLRCGLIWFGGRDQSVCPEGPHGLPVRVAVICRDCDIPVPLERISDHLSSALHKISAKK